MIHTAAYCASKGVVNLIRQLAVDYTSHRIHVNAVCPGFLATALVRPFLDKKETNKVLHQQNPWPHLGTPEDVSKADSRLASDAASWMTGGMVQVDGGFTAKQLTRTCITTRNFSSGDRGSPDSHLRVRIFEQFHPRFADWWRTCLTVESSIKPTQIDAGAVGVRQSRIQEVTLTYIFVYQQPQLTQNFLGAYSTALQTSTLAPMGRSSSLIS